MAAEAHAFEIRRSVLDQALSEVEAANHFPAELAELGAADVRRAVAQLPHGQDGIGKAEGVGADERISSAESFDFKTQSERALTRLRAEAERSAVKRELATLVTSTTAMASSGTAVTLGEGSSSSAEHSQGIEHASVNEIPPLVRNVKLCEALHARKLAHQVVDRFEALERECLGLAEGLVTSMHDRIAALLTLEDSRLSHMTKVLDELAYAGESVVAWRASNQSSSRVLQTTAAHRTASSLRAAAQKEDAAAAAQQATRVAKAAEELDCAVLQRKLPERPGTIFSIDAIFAAGLECQARGFAAPDTRLGRPFMLEKVEFCKVLREHWIPEQTDESVSTATAEAIATALCKFTPDAQHVDDVLIDWREFVHAALLSGGVVQRAPTVTELLETRTALHGASSPWHRARVDAFHTDDGSYDVAYFSPRDVEYSSPVHFERRVPDTFLRPVSHEQRISEAIEAQWDAPLRKEGGLGQKYAIGVHVEARRTRLSYDEFVDLASVAAADHRLWFESDMNPDDADALRRLYFQLWSCQEQAEQGLWLDPLDLVLTWCAHTRHSDDVDPRYCVGIHRAIVVLSRPPKPRYVPTGIAAVGKLELARLLERHIARGLPVFPHGSGSPDSKTTFADLCAAGTVFSPCYNVVDVYKIAASQGLY